LNEKVRNKRNVESEKIILEGTYYLEENLNIRAKKEMI
jgi:hypothetical protein